MKKRTCPSCGNPALSVWQLLRVGALRYGKCSSCGVRIAVSSLSSLAVSTLGTAIPIAGAVIGAIAAAGVGGGAHMLVGGACGLVLSSAVFVSFYFRRARLIVE
jgi:hypothetical protein